MFNVWNSKLTYNPQNKPLEFSLYIELKGSITLQF